MPPEIAWEEDNSGFQLGNSSNKIKNILFSFDLTENVVDEAIEKNCNLIISHHPILFKSLKKLNTATDHKSKIISKCIRNDISAAAFHTTFDYIENGVSFLLARKLGLKNIDFLEKHSGLLYKIVVYVPSEKAETVAEAMFEAGAGNIGNYDKCSFSVTGKGTFRGNDDSSPVYGVKNNFENVDEDRIEVISEKWKIQKVINAMLKAHPYEEPAYDIIKTENRHTKFGIGAIGEFETEILQEEFLEIVSKQLNTSGLKYCLGRDNKVKKVAVCGGSGSYYTGTALRNGCDAYVTADISYHTFQDYENRILLIDAGHYETENLAMSFLADKVKNFIEINEKNILVNIYSGITNPVKFFKL